MGKISLLKQSADYRERVKNCQLPISDFQLAAARGKILENTSS
jgi:hypothetical protein